MKWSNWLWVILLVLIIVWFATPDYITDIDNNNKLAYQSLFLEEEFISNSREKSIPNIDSHVLYWEENNISYQFVNDSCEPERREEIERAFKEIKSYAGNSIEFIEDYSTQEAIFIECISKSESVIASGYGGVEYYVGNQKIFRGDITLYWKVHGAFEHCGDYPDVEIHEILHALGFDHIENRVSVMNSVGNYPCLRIEPPLSNCLKHIYSNESENYTCQGIPFLY